MNFIDDPVVTDSDTIGVPAFQLFAASRARIAGERHSSVDDPVGLFLG
jgi:hypothetical protein